MYKGLGRGRGRPLDGVGPKNHIKVIKLTTFRTEYRKLNTAAAKLMYIKLPMSRFFMWKNFFRGPLAGGWALKIETYGP
jgi:hypothetical protein